MSDERKAMASMKARDCIGFCVMCWVTLGISCSDSYMASDRCPPCGAHGVCDEALGKCGCEAAYGGSQCDRCATGFIRVDDQCVPGMCGDNGDCNDGNPCNGEETC
ncbi:MAG TPA: hypothetical protein PLJ27_24120, partial [Polyangiaceae bacterium]|nr:hypothetical protein [Polyangiaceae bacterium]